VIGPKSRKPVFDEKDFETASSASMRVNAYHKYLLELRKKRHINRVKKTRFLSKLIREEKKKEPFPFGTFGMDYGHAHGTAK